MACRFLIVAVGLLSIGSASFAPITWANAPGKDLTLLPQSFTGPLSKWSNDVPQILAVGEPVDSRMAFFSAKHDNTISVEGWCVEAVGAKIGDAVNVNVCNGGAAQQWNWIPEGHGRKKIQLHDTNLCLDVDHKEGRSNGAAVQLHQCEETSSESWLYEAPEFGYGVQHVMMALMSLAGVGALSLGAWPWQHHSKAPSLLGGMPRTESGVSMTTPMAFTGDTGCSSARSPFSRTGSARMSMGDATEDDMVEGGANGMISERSTSLKTNISLSAGLELPTLGFGTFRLQGAACEAAITHALDSGFRLIDTGSIYKNEESVGSAIRAWAGDDASRRGSVLVTSKCSSYEMGYDRAIAACEASIQRLGVDAIDLYLIHWPAVARKKHSSDIHRKARHETWCALEELHRRCRVRAIGVSNFTVAHLEQLLEDGVKVVPMVNQVEAHPFCIPSDVIAFCQGRGIVIQAYAPLGGGPYSNSAKASGGEINGTNLLLGNAIVREIASETGRTAAQVLLRWGIEQGFVVLPQSTNPERIAENASVFNFSLNAAQVTRLSALAAQEGLTQKFCWDPSSVQ